jgi:hypothetical protein
MRVAIVVIPASGYPDAVPAGSKQGTILRSWIPVFTGNPGFPIKTSGMTNTDFCKSLIYLIWVKLYI